MITIKLNIKDKGENNVELKVISPKNIENATNNEIETSKFIIDELNKIFNK